MARVWKARMGQTIAGSNPALSANYRNRPRAVSVINGLKQIADYWEWAPVRPVEMTEK